MVARSKTKSTHRNVFKCFSCFDVKCTAWKKSDIVLSFADAKSTLLVPYVNVMWGWDWSSATEVFILNAQPNRTLLADTQDCESTAVSILSFSSNLLLDKVTFQGGALEPLCFPHISLERMGSHTLKLSVSAFSVFILTFILPVIAVSRQHCLHFLFFQAQCEKSWSLKRLHGTKHLCETRVAVPKQTWDICILASPVNVPLIKDSLGGKVERKKKFWQH